MQTVPRVVQEAPNRCAACAHFAQVKAKKRRRKPAAHAGGGEVACPYCGEPETPFVDEGGGAHQTYVEDCAVCCRPRVVHVEPGDEPGEVRVWLERGDE